jgi:CTP:molybdopterin cytidylyltransferase MocA
LAAGLGRRFGTPKALVDNGSGPWVVRSLDVLAACEPRLVVIGASAAHVAALVPSDVHVVTNPDYRQGMGSSLRAGLTALTSVTTRTAQHAEPPIDAVLVMLVDLPGVGPDVVARILRAAGSDHVRSALLRAAYDGRPGHPVFLGRDHWEGVTAAAIGDRGAREYLSGQPVRLVECADIGSGIDVDRPGGHR